MNWNTFHFHFKHILGHHFKIHQKTLRVLKAGCRWEVVIMVIDQHTSTLLPVFSFYQLKATTSLRLPSYAHWRGNVWEKDVKCELPRCCVYESNQLWTRSWCSHVGIHLASYDVWQVFINGATDVKAMKTTINKVSLFWFWWKHMVRVIEYSLALSHHVRMLCLHLKTSSLFDEAPETHDLHMSNIFSPPCTGVHWS